MNNAIQDVNISAHELCEKLAKELGPMETEREHRINDIIIGMSLKEITKKKEFHWFADFDDLGAAIFNSNSELHAAHVGCGFMRTQQLIEDGRDIIVSDQSHFFSQNTIDKGYDLYVHWPDKLDVKVARGLVVCGRLITEKQNLEKLLLAGEFKQESSV